MPSSEEAASPLVHICGFDLARFVHHLRTADRLDEDGLRMPHGWTLGPAILNPPTDEQLLPVLERAHALAEASEDRNATYLARLALLIEWILNLEQWDTKTRYAAALALIHKGAEAHKFTFRYRLDGGEKVLFESGYALCRPGPGLFEYYSTAPRIQRLLEDAYEPPQSSRQTSARGKTLRPSGQWS